MKKESLSIVYQDGEAKDEEFFICFFLGWSWVKFKIKYDCSGRDKGAITNKVRNRPKITEKLSFYMEWLSNLKLR